jgi:EPS-associated MarR family transcriptional regulator
MSRQADLQEDTNFRVMRILEEHPEISQRELSKKLGVSLGGINYCLSALIDKGFIKAKNFSNNANKVSYAYLLTPKGIREKSQLTVRFLQRKMQEYEDLRREIELPRPRDLELTYTPEFADIVHELRGHIGAIRSNTPLTT